MARFTLSQIEKELARRQKPTAQQQGLQRELSQPAEFDVTTGMMPELKDIPTKSISVEEKDLMPELEPDILKIAPKYIKEKYGELEGDDQSYARRLVEAPDVRKRLLETPPLKKDVSEYTDEDFKILFLKSLAGAEEKYQSGQMSPIEMAKYRPIEWATEQTLLFMSLGEPVSPYVISKVAGLVVQGFKKGIPIVKKIPSILKEAEKALAKPMVGEVTERALTRGEIFAQDPILKEIKRIGITPESMAKDLGLDSKEVAKMHRGSIKTAQQGGTSADDAAIRLREAGLYKPNETEYNIMQDMAERLWHGKKEVPIQWESLTPLEQDLYVQFQSKYGISPTKRELGTEKAKITRKELPTPTVKVTPVQKIPPVATGEVKPSIITDSVRVQEIKNSMREGELLLQSGKSSIGKPLTTEEKWIIRKSIENDRAKLGEGMFAKKEYSIEDVTPEGYGPTSTVFEVKKPPVSALPPEKPPTGIPPSPEPIPNPEYKKLKSWGEKTLTSSREFIEDSWIRVKKLQQTKGLKISDASNPYQAHELMPGRIQSRTSEFLKQSQGIEDDINRISKSTEKKFAEIEDEIDNYLWARHTPERNAIHGEKAAGMTTEEANRLITEIKAKPYFKDIEPVINKISELNKKTLDTLLEGGVITEDLYKTLRKTYPNHIPLNRVLTPEDDIVGVLTGKGLDIRGSGLRRAYGSDKPIADVLTNVVSNYENAIIRAEKNIVDNATLNFIRDNKEVFGDLFVIKKPQAVGMTFGGGKVPSHPIMEKITDPKILQLYEKGKSVLIEIQDPKLALAFRGVNELQRGDLLNITGSITRFYSGLYTRFNPEFALPNGIRDLQESVVYSMATKDLKASKVTFKQLKLEGHKAVIDSLRGKDTAGAKLYKQMVSDGGTTGGMALSTRKAVEIRIDKLRKIAQSSPRRALQKVFEVIDDWNTVFEDSTRYAIYKTALENGATRSRAAFLAKEGTINFNRKGTGGAIINSLYMFSNASIQGSVKMIKALKNPKVAGVVVTAIGTSVFATGQWNDWIDPNWREKVSKWDRMNSLTVMLPNGNYISIPVSWGLKPIKVTMDAVYDVTTGQDITVGDASKKIITATLDAYNPIGGQDFISAMTPTLLDPFVDIAKNEKWTGAKIKPVIISRKRPEWSRYYPSLEEETVGKIMIKIAEGADAIGLEVSPADLNYLFQQMTGGAGQFVSKTINTITSIGKGELPDSKQTPFLSRFYRQPFNKDEQVSVSPRPFTKQDIENAIKKKLIQKIRQKMRERQLQGVR